jgi:hypothetical protein
MELIINSRDRTSGTPSDYYVQLPYGAAIAGKTKVSLRTVVIKNSVFTINSTNDRLWCSIRTYTNANTFTEDMFQVTVPRGTYPYTSLVTKLTTLVPQALALQHASYPALEVGVSHSEYNSKFAVAVTSAFGRGDGGRWFHVCDESYDAQMGGFVGSLNELMGFVSQHNPPTPMSTAPAYTIEASQMDDVQGDGSLYLCTDIITGGSVRVASGRYSAGGVLAHVPVASFGRSGVYEPFTPLQHTLNQDTIASIHIYWLDAKLQRPDLNSQEHTIVLRFE